MAHFKIFAIFSAVFALLWNVHAFFSNDAQTATGTHIVIGTPHNTSYTCGGNTWYSDELCPGMGLEVTYAYYGRYHDDHHYTTILYQCTDQTKCHSNDPFNCNDCRSNVTAVFQSTFANPHVTFPSLRATSQDLLVSDPCVNYRKYLAVTYACVKEVTWTVA